MWISETRVRDGAIRHRVHTHERSDLRARNAEEKRNGVFMRSE